MLSEIRGVPIFPSLIANDKLVHVALYAVMGTLLGLGTRLSGIRRRWLPLLVGYAYAAVDEWHQWFVPRRVPSLGDFAADVVGVTIGFLIVLALLADRRPHREQSHTPDRA